MPHLTTQPQGLEARALPPVALWQWSASLILSALALGTAFAVVVTTLEGAAITEVGGGSWGVAAMGALVSLPLFALVSLAAAGIAGMLIAVLDRSFSFRRLVLLTLCAIAAAVLATSIGAMALMGGATAPVAIGAVAIVHVAVALAYAGLLERIAGVRRAAAVIVGAGLTMTTGITMVLGITHA